MNIPMNTTEVEISYEYLKNIVESSLDIICKIDKCGRFVWLNSACERTWGYEINDLLGKNYLDFVLAADHVTSENVATQVMNGRDFTDFQNRYIKKDGSVVPMVWSATWNSAEETMHCVARDATEKMNAQMRLQESEHCLKEALRIAKIGTWTYHAASNTATWSEELYELYGVKRNNCTGLVSLFKSMVHPEDIALVEDGFLNATSVVTPFIHRLVRPDGKIIHVKQRISRKPNNDETGDVFTGTTLDVTDEVGNETQLLYREQRFKSLLANNLDMVGILDSVGNYSYVSENTAEVIGYEADFLLGKNAFEFIHPEDAPVVFERFTSFNKDVKELAIPPFRFKSASGDWLWIECKVTDQTEDPVIQGLIVNSRDVSLKKAADEKILSLSRIVEDTPNAVVLTDVDGHIIWVNKGFSKITEYSLEECIGKKPGQLLQGKDSNPEIIALMKQRILEEKQFDVEIINYSKTGRAYWMSIQCQPHFDVQNKLIGFFAIQTDITEKKNLQERLSAEEERRQKEITAHIVIAQEKERDEIGKELHDNVNQILSTVKLYLGMMQEDQENMDELVSKSMGYVQDCIDEIRHISKRLSIPHQNDLGLEEAVEQLVQSVAASVKMCITYKPYHLEKRKAPENVQLSVYRIIQEHLTNILKHAGATNVKVALGCIGNVLELKIVDDGKGFDVKAKRNGIGISNIKNRALVVNGKVVIKSAPGAGCTLYGTFPME